MASTWARLSQSSPSCVVHWRIRASQNVARWLSGWDGTRERRQQSRHRWITSTPRAMAQPRKKGPTKTVKIHCANCRTFLYKYQKAGKGSLVKCWHERIVDDATKGDLTCPECGIEFARPAMIRGRPANKIIGGKVTMQK